MTPLDNGPHGSARAVLDYIAWIEHVAWVESVCDTTTTAVAMFGIFKRSASAERGHANAR